MSLTEHKEWAKFEAWWIKNQEYHAIEIAALWETWQAALDSQDGFQTGYKPAPAIPMPGGCCE